MDNEEEQKIKCKFCNDKGKIRISYQIVKEDGTQTNTPIIEEFCPKKCKASKKASIQKSISWQS